MSMVVVGIGDVRISTDGRATLVTYALGSCIAVLAHDAGRKIGGLLHFVLPDSSLNLDRARQHPAVFADTGVPLLLDRMEQAGATRKNLQIRIVGGAQMLEGPGALDVGKRNQLALKKVFWKAGVMVVSEQLGGDQARTVRMEVDSGRAFVRTGSGAEQEWKLERRTSDAAPFFPESLAGLRL
jgi:chemotaxis protein CheD